MTGAVHAAESVEHFARLCAALDDPFADRTAVLAAAGLSETAFVRLQETWITRLRGERGEEVAAQLGRTYAGKAKDDAGEGPNPTDVEAGGRTSELPDAAVSAPPASGTDRNSSPPLEVPSFMREGAPSMSAISTATTEVDLGKILRQPVPFEPTTTPPDAARPSPKASSPPMSTGTEAVDVAAILEAPVPFSKDSPRAESAPSRAKVTFTPETAEIDLTEISKQAVPFSAAPSAPEVRSGSAAKAAAPAYDGAPTQTEKGLGETREIDLAAILKRGKPVPFAPADAPPGRGRWIRFNPQTGEPLLTPHWEELGPNSDDEK